MLTAVWDRLCRLVDPRPRAREAVAHVGEVVCFAHPTRRRDVVVGELVAVNDSPLCVAWVALTVRPPGGVPVVYQVDARARLLAGGR